MVTSSGRPLFVANDLSPLHEGCINSRLKVASVCGGGIYRNQTFSILYCPLCSLGFSDPIPTEDTAHLLYEDRESFDFQPNESQLVTNLKMAAARRDLKSFCNTVVASAATMLDYGCGNGTYTRAIQQLFPDATVIGADLHSSSPHALRPEDYASYEDLFTMQGVFDFVLCRHVLEHSYDPVGLVNRIAKLLKPCGVLAVEVPSLKTGVKHLFGKYWDGYYAPFHTMHFSKVSLAATLQKAGLTVFRQGGAEMPKMGRSIQNVLNCKYNPILFATGIVLQPLQIGVGLLTGTSVCLRAWGRKSNP